MKIFYISVLACNNMTINLEFYFDSEANAVKFIENTINDIKKTFNNIVVNKFVQEKSFHVYNSCEINHKYRIHELKKYEVMK